MRRKRILHVQQNIPNDNKCKMRVLTLLIRFKAIWFIVNYVTGFPPDNESASQGPLIRDCKDGCLNAVLQRESTSNIFENKNFYGRHAPKQSINLMPQTFNFERRVIIPHLWFMLAKIYLFLTMNISDQIEHQVHSY